MLRCYFYDAAGFLEFFTDIEVHALLAFLWLSDCSRVVFLIFAERFSALKECEASFRCPIVYSTHISLYDISLQDELHLWKCEQASGNS